MRVRATVFTAIAVLAAVGLGAAAPANAGDDFYGENWDDEWSYADESGGVRLRGSIGAIGIEAREYVYNLAGSTDKTSLLIWQSVAPIATMEVDIALPDDWTFEARARAALFGDSYMEDYDWFGPDFVSYADSDWTHRSLHPNTNLDWYLDGSIEIGKNIVAEPVMTVNLNGGFRYTDVQWTAHGGSFIYSDSAVDNPGNNFRAYSGTFADVPVITYRQQLPVLYAGLDVEATDGDWTYAAEGQVGMTAFGLATDHHWLRDLRFLDHIRPAPVFSASASVEYAFSENLAGFLSASIDKLFVARADAETYDIPTGTLTSSFPDSTGAELGTLSVSAGIRGSF